MCSVGGVRMKAVGSGWIGLKKKEGFVGRWQKRYSLGQLDYLKGLEFSGLTLRMDKGEEGLVGMGEGRMGKEKVELWERRWGDRVDEFYGETGMDPTGTHPIAAYECL